MKKERSELRVNPDIDEAKFERLYRTCLDKAQETLRSAHYAKMDVEPIDFARSVLTHEQLTGAYLFSIIKYVGRYNMESAGKGGAKDLLKAKDYLDWLIELEGRR